MQRLNIEGGVEGGEWGQGQVALSPLGCQMLLFLRPGSWYRLGPKVSPLIFPTPWRTRGYLAFDPNLAPSSCSLCLEEWGPWVSVFYFFTFLAPDHEYPPSLHSGSLDRATHGAGWAQSRSFG